MDEEKLIILVSGYKELYDFSNKNYSNEEPKNNCWKEISEHMRQPVSACKDRWSRLRDNYRKALKFRKCKSGDPAVKMRPYKFEAEMSFLKKYLPDRDQKTNVTEPVSDLNSPKPEDGEDDRIEDTDNLSDSGRVTPASTAASSSNNNTIQPTPLSAPKRKKVQPQNTQPSSVASVLEKYLQTTTATNSGSSSLKQFFIAMSETAQSFPPELQIEVKSNIFNVIKEAELKCLQPRNTMQFGNRKSTGFHGNQNVYQQRPKYTQHSQDIQLSHHPQNMQSSETQPNMTHLQHTQHSQGVSQPSHTHNTIAAQPQLTLLQDMQPSLLQHMHSTYSSTSTSFVGSPELQSDNESNLM